MKSNFMASDAASAIPDPSAACARGNPYAVIASAGVTPDSTLAEMREASFALMAREDLDDSWRDAWDELRIVPRRLVVDFFFYHQPGCAEVSHDG